MNPSRVTESSAAVGRWRALTSESAAVGVVRRVVGSLIGRRRNAQSTAGSLIDENVVIRIGASSLAIRALTWPGRWLVRAWPDSLCAIAWSDWRAIPLDRRVRAVAVALVAAIVTHITLTGFSAPEPTRAVRATWIALIIILLTIAGGARTIAAAWQDWYRRRMASRESETA